MLVLTRKVNQQIRLGEDITITVLRVQGNSIRIGVDAPRNVRVLRSELEPRDEAAPEVARETLEFDLHDMSGSVPAEETDCIADAECLADSAAGDSSDRPRVYQMRTTAPLSRFVRSSATALSGSLSLQ